MARSPQAGMLDQFDKISESVAFIRSRWSLSPKVAIILGSGLGGISGTLADAVTIPYDEIPHFARSTAHGHAGQFVCGLLDGVPVVVMEGRMHAYEGYPLQQITFPVRVMKRLGAELLVVTNACGGLNPQYRTGDLMVIEDHINLLGDNPLIGINDERLGPRFPDMSAPYTPALVEAALAVARREDFVAHRGEPRDPGRVSLPPDDRGRRGRHVHRSRGAGGRPFLDAGARHFRDHRHVPPRRPRGGHRGAHPRRGPLSRAEAAGDHPGGREG